MRVDDDVGAESLGGERHVGLGHDEPDRPLLAAPATHLVADRRHSVLSHAHLCQPEALVALGHERAIDHATRSLFGDNGRVCEHSGVVDVGRPHPDHDRLVIEDGALAHDAVLVEVAVVVARAHPHHLVCVDVDEPRVHLRPSHGRALLARLVHRVVGRTEEAALDRSLVDQHRVLDVVAAVAHDGHNRVLSVGVLLAVDVLQVAALHKGDLTVLEDDGRLVDAVPVVCRVERSALLALPAREEVPRQLVVLGVHDLVPHDAEDERGVDLEAKGAPRLDLLPRHRDVQPLGFRSVRVPNGCRGDIGHGLGHDSARLV